MKTELKIISVSVEDAHEAVEVAAWFESFGYQVTHIEIVPIHAETNER